MKDLELKMFEGNWKLDELYKMGDKFFNIHIYHSVKNECFMGSVLFGNKDVPKRFITAPLALFSDHIERYRLRIGELNMPIKYFCCNNTYVVFNWNGLDLKFRKI